MQVSFVLALIALVAFASAQDIKPQCESQFRNGNCAVCVATSTPSSAGTVGGLVECGWCPGPSTSEPGMCMSSGAGCSAGFIERSAILDCPASTGGPPPSCDPAAHISSCPEPGLMRECDVGEIPLPGDAPACCLSCRPACPQGVSPARQTAPACAPGVAPSVNRTTCQFDCRVIPSCQDPTAVRECDAAETPSLDTATGCPTCRPAPTQDCSAADCSAVRACDAGEIPTTAALDGTNNLCCPNCRPQPPCNPAQCEATYSSLDECATGVTPVFDQTTCCVDCRRPTTAPPAAGCSREDAVACLADAPVCQTGEERLFDASASCCASCKRPFRACALTDVAKCAKTQRECAVGEFPAMIEGSCCATCRIPPPTCTGCTDTQICVYRPDEAGTAVAPECRAFETRTFSFDAPADAGEDIRTDLQGFDATSARETLMEFVERTCSNAAFAARCAKYRAMLIRSTRCELTSTAGELPITIDCKIPVSDEASSSGTAAGTRDASDDTPAGLVDASVEQESATAGFNVGDGSDDGTTSSNGEESPAAATAPVLFTVLLLALAALVAA